MDYLLGIDSGLTVTKAVVFDTDGRARGLGRRRVPPSMPRPRLVERDPEALWRACAEAIGEALVQAGVAPSAIAAVGLAGHGDGLFLLDRARRPLGPAILSLDSRAVALVGRWKADGIAAEALRLTGQEPHPAAPSALLAWLKDADPQRYDAIGTVLACKDWLRFRLCGTVGTDRTEASTSFTDLRTQAYTPRALALYGLEALAHALPPVALSTEIVGAVTPEAASATGLRPGTPVACGLHDVTATALGIGGLRPGRLSIVVGTYSINEVVSEAPVVDPRWLCRNAVMPRQWMNMAISPASTANLEWFLDSFCRAEQERARAENRSVHEVLATELERARTRAAGIVFHPFLFGSPYGGTASASFLGLRGWHERGDLLYAVLEGIVFNHRTHVDALRARFRFAEARIAGGGARSPALGQMFADAMGLPMIVTAVEEAGALGAALAAGVGIGVYPDLDTAMGRAEQVARRHEPQESERQHLDDRFALYTAVAEALAPLWPRLGAAGG
ncbi:MAG: carbohydrate kinase [Rhodospirillaceae bacterium]|nr:carbohydrate kinase [Rhodospirillaceae bacterium]